MWLRFNDGFIGVVENRHNPAKFLVRARRGEILLRLFPTKQITRNDAEDYRYRVEVRREELLAIVTERLRNINYPNFKESVDDYELHRLYADFWSLHRSYQR